MDKFERKRIIVLALTIISLILIGMSLFLPWWEIDVDYSGKSAEDYQIKFTPTKTIVNREDEKDIVEDHYPYNSEYIKSNVGQSDFQEYHYSNTYDTAKKTFYILIFIFILLIIMSITIFITGLNSKILKKCHFLSLFCIIVTIFLLIFFSKSLPDAWEKDHEEKWGWELWDSEVDGFWDSTVTDSGSKVQWGPGIAWFLVAICIVLNIINYWLLALLRKEEHKKQIDAIFDEKIKVPLKRILKFRKKYVSLFFVIFAIILLISSIFLPWWKTEGTVNEDRDKNLKQRFSWGLRHQYYSEYYNNPNSSLDPFNGIPYEKRTHNQFEKRAANRVCDKEFDMLNKTFYFLILTIIFSISAIISLLLHFSNKISFKKAIAILLISLILTGLLIGYFFFVYPQAYKYDMKEPYLEREHEIPNESEAAKINGFYGSTTISKMDYKWGPNNGWYFIVFAFISNLIALLILVKYRHEHKPKLVKKIKIPKSNIKSIKFFIILLLIILIIVPNILKTENPSKNKTFDGPENLIIKNISIGRFSQYNEKIIYQQSEEISYEKYENYLTHIDLEKKEVKNLSRFPVTNRIELYDIYEDKIIWLENIYTQIDENEKEFNGSNIRLLEINSKDDTVLFSYNKSYDIRRLLFSNMKIVYYVEGNKYADENETGLFIFDIQNKTKINISKNYKPDVIGWDEGTRTDIAFDGNEIVWIELNDIEANKQQNKDKNYDEKVILYNISTNQSKGISKSNYPYRGFLNINQNYVLWVERERHEINDGKYEKWLNISVVLFDLKNEQRKIIYKNSLINKDERIAYYPILLSENYIFWKFSNETREKNTKWKFCEGIISYDIENETYYKNYFMDKSEDGMWCGINHYLKFFYNNRIYFSLNIYKIPFYHFLSYNSYKICYESEMEEEDIWSLDLTHDTDKDGIPDFKDLDDDNDNFIDEKDMYPYDPKKHEIEKKEQKYIFGFEASIFFISIITIIFICKFKKFKSFR